jgi:hypothetical protein
MEYKDMTIQQRAEYLLAKGVEAKIDIDPEKVNFAYTPHVIGVGKLNCGYYITETEAIEAGIAWLRKKALPAEPTNLPTEGAAP